MTAYEKGSKMTCPQCGSQVPNGATVCPNCGSPLNGTPSQSATGTSADSASLPQTNNQQTYNQPGNQQPSNQQPGPEQPWQQPAFQSQNGQPGQTGQYPTGNGQYPNANGQTNPNPTSNGQVPQNQTPNGQYPTGQYPTGQYPTGQVPAGQMQTGQVYAQQAPTDPKTKRRNKIIIIVIAVVAVLALIIGGVFAALKSNAPTPEKTIKSYLTALSEGNFDQANSMTVSSALPKTRDLMTSEMGKKTTTRISNTDISMTGNDTARVSYKVGERYGTAIVKVTPEGKTMGFFNNYKISQPLIAQISVTMPQQDGNITVNDKSFKQSIFTVSDKTTTIVSSDSSYTTFYTAVATYKVDAYPGMYTVSINDSNIYEKASIDDVAYTLSTSSSTYSETMRPTVKDSFSSSLLSSVKSSINSCVSRTEPTADNCGFINLKEEDLNKNGKPSSGVTRSLTSSLESLRVTANLSTGRLATNTIFSRLKFTSKEGDKEYLNQWIKFAPATGKFSMEGSTPKVTLDSSYDSTKNSVTGTAYRP